MTKQTVAAIWQELLGASEIKDDDDFFALGGDSMGIMMLMHRVEQDLGLILDPSIMFEAPTFGAFAAAVEAQLEPSA